MMPTTPYETLVESAARLTDVDTLADFDAADASSASELLKQNQDALESARRVLGPTCVVPVRYEEAFLAEHCDHVSHLRNLGCAFRTEAWLAASRNDFRTAALIAIDILELANAVRRGGLVTDLLVGIAISGLAIESLRKIRTKIDSDTRRLVMNELHRLEAEREPLADIVTRDQDWEIAVGCEDIPYEFMSLDELRKMERDADYRILALMRLLRIDLAIRDRHATSGSFPNDLSSLMPEPLAELPLDPYTENSFIYRRISAASFDLYSTGPKLTDGGGHFGPWPKVAAGCADLCLDAYDYT